MEPIKNIMYKFGMSLRQTTTYETHKKYIKKQKSPGGNRQNKVSRDCRRTKGGGLALLRRREKPFGNKNKILDI